MYRSIWLMALLAFVMPQASCVHQTNLSNPELSEDRTALTLFEDSMTGDWRAQWFLDGTQATLRNSDNGLYFAGGTVSKLDDREKYHAHHAVLWTRQVFEGDLRIRFQMTREDQSDYGNTLLYIQAQGIGTEPYVEDITAWNALREIPEMATYFTFMDLISVSFRENVRCKRYPWRNPAGEWYEGKGLIEPMLEYEGIEPGETYQVQIEKTAEALTLWIYSADETELLAMESWDLTQIDQRLTPPLIQKGRIGLRHMSTKQFTYRDFVVERLETGATTGADAGVAAGSDTPGEGVARGVRPAS